MQSQVEYRTHKIKLIIDSKAYSERITEAGTLKGNNETIHLGEGELKMSNL